MTNHHEGWQNQVLRWLAWYEKIWDYGKFLEWSQKQDKREQEARIQKTTTKKMET